MCKVKNSPTPMKSVVSLDGGFEFVFQLKNVLDF